MCFVKNDKTIYYGDLRIVTAKQIGLFLSNVLIIKAMFAGFIELYTKIESDSNDCSFKKRVLSYMLWFLTKHYSGLIGVHIKINLSSVYLL